MREMDPQRRLVVVGGTDRWLRGVLRRAEQVRLVTEREEWVGAPSVSLPFCGIGASLAGEEVEQESSALECWASAGFQAAVVASLEPVAGVAGRRARLKERGYRRILLARPKAHEDGDYWTALGDHLADLAPGHLALVPILVDLLGRSDIGFIRLLEAVVRPRCVWTVTHLCKRLGVKRHGLVTMLRDLGLPGPKRTLDLIRLALAIYAVGALGDTAQGAARLVGYQSAKYLRQRCRRLTDYSFTELVERGLPAVAALLRAG